MGTVSDFLFGKKTLEKAAGKKEEPKTPPPQSTDYLKEQIKKSVPPKPAPAPPGAMEKLKKGVK